VDLGRFALHDAGDDVKAPWKKLAGSELNDRAGGSGHSIGHREDEPIDIGLEQRTDAHRARLDRGEHDDAAKVRTRQSARRFAYDDDHGVRGRIAACQHLRLSPRDHRLVQNGDGAIGRLPCGRCGTCLRQRGAHVQLVIHAPIVQPGAAVKLPLKCGMVEYRITVNFEQRMSTIRWSLILAGGIGAGLILAFTVVGSGHFDMGSMGAGQDAHAYWRAVRVPPYSKDAGDFGAYLYSPAFVQGLDPVLGLPWEQFLTIWACLALATLLVLTGPVLFVFALPVAFFEIWGGNIHLLLALAIVVGFRWSGTWSFVLLTKVTPGIGLLWFAARREWRKLGFALGTTAFIVAASVALNPELWRSWIELLVREASGTASGGHIPIPFWVRLPFAAALAIYAGRSSRRWLLPVVAFLAMPVLWWGSLSVLIGCVALERERLERLVLTALANFPVWMRDRVAGPSGDFVPEPEA
jgi:hypothetical protein